MRLPDASSKTNGFLTVAKPSAKGRGCTTIKSVFDTLAEFETLRFSNLEKSDTEKLTAQAMETRIRTIMMDILYQSSIQDRRAGCIMSPVIFQDRESIASSRVQ